MQASQTTVFNVARIASWPNGADVERKVIVRRQLKRRYFLAGQNALSK